MGIVHAKPSAVETKQRTPAPIKSGISVTTEDTIAIGKVNQAISQAYGELAKLKTDDLSLQHSPPQFDNLKAARAELAKVQQQLQQLGVDKVSRRPLEKSYTSPTSSATNWDSASSSRKRRVTIELKHLNTDSPRLLSQSPLKVSGRMKELCKSTEDEDGLDESVGGIDGNDGNDDNESGSDECTPPSSVSVTEMMQALRRKISPPGLESVRLMSVHTDQNPSMRKHQEDMFLYTDPLPTARPREGMFAVFDGHGGRACVELVFKRLRHNVLAALRESSSTAGTESSDTTSGEESMGVSVLDEIDRCITKAFLATDDDTKGHDLMTCGSTAGMIYIHRRGGATWVHVANVGDTRAVICRGGKVSRLTIDHTPACAEEAKRIVAAGGIVMGHRVCGRLAVTRTFGDHGLKDSGVIANPYQTRFPLTKEIQFIIIASDGLWDVLDDQAAAKIVLSSGTQNEWKVARSLAERAIELGSRDNVTTMVIFF